MATLSLWGYEVEANAAAGSLIIVDGWNCPMASVLEDSGYHGFPFRLPSLKYTTVKYAVLAVRVTGRTLQKLAYQGGMREWVRVEITFANEGEQPDTVCKGWMKV